MNILVCIKQVPSSSNVKIDPVTGTLIRDGSNVKMNPYDLFALEMALLIKEKKGAHVKAITMGPPMSASILNEALYMGCDEGVLI
ncbi:MAG: electron transfer flavoprotein subunit beta, partial [Bacilli bacterium]|nr:electron transfer flavoprotein subunit beta [Bacilli bacterium]